MDRELILGMGNLTQAEYEAVTKYDKTNSAGGDTSSEERTMEQFRSINRKTALQLEQIYHYDFLLFEYDPTKYINVTKV